MKSSEFRQNINTVSIRVTTGWCYNTATYYAPAPWLEKSNFFK